MSSSPRKNQTAKGFKKIWQFLNDVGKNTLDIGEKENTGEMGEEHTGRFFHLNIRWFMRKGSGDSCPRNATGALLKEQNHNFAERFIDSKWIAKYYKVIFIHLNWLNSFMHGMGKIVLDVPKTSSRLKAKCSFASIELKWKNIYVFGINHICRRGRN